MPTKMGLQKREIEMLCDLAMMQPLTHSCTLNPKGALLLESASCHAALSEQTRALD